MPTQLFPQPLKGYFAHFIYHRYRRETDLFHAPCPSSGGGVGVYSIGLLLPGGGVKHLCQWQAGLVAGGFQWRAGSVQSQGLNLGA
ncbi:hypothetical protein GCM10010052_10990 [Paenarthrobacter histidinolovorans]|nr:hypothetical protein GCM10010052_10990 [Paenarthrobacter histidinolovorans]